MLGSEKYLTIFPKLVMKGLLRKYVILIVKKGQRGRDDLSIRFGKRRNIQLSSKLS